MDADEVRDASRLAAVAVRGLAARIQETHAGIAGRVFATVGPASAPVRAMHDAITGLTYGTVRLALGAGSVVAGHAVAGQHRGPHLEDSPAGRIALAILNGLHGDRVQ